MTEAAQIRGVLLEEAVLYLLRSAGYSTVVTSTGDPTLGTCAAGMTVAGRGARHQVDAVADFRLGLPFSNPQRLLVEAKFLQLPVGLPVIRGTLGVLKDVSEYWVASSRGGPAASRYHYLAAIFSSSPFTAEAQDYAFAHDIHLLPLGRSAALRRVLQAIEAHAAVLAANSTRFQLREIRHAVRQQLQPQKTMAPPFSLRSDRQDHPASEELEVFRASAVNDALDVTAPLASEVRSLDSCLVAMLGRSFPIFLTPYPGVSIAELPPAQQVEIHFESPAASSGWSVSTPGGAALFTFDLPETLFARHADEGFLTDESAIELKEQLFSGFTATHVVNGSFRVLEFRLDRNWIQSLKRSVGIRE